ncbi:hypothetical protein D0T12_15000 [Actinomadura spongiicola]|uniref:DUF6879 domain-containing protein n=1 Tax=Actinomadura spongiicola TaxID=2303421 RepID=A0A372GHH5_9ACTN|nr:hypothetical protein D0T12_15000 [Actinomadura spongiicola]
MDEEREHFEDYLTGKPLPPDRNAEWARNIRERVAAGGYMGRVHIIDHTLTPYLQFEIDWYYAINGAAGEDVRFIFREDVPDVTYTDTWLFDDEIVIDLSYDKEGRLLYLNRNDDPERLREARTAWHEFHARSFPLADLLSMIRSEELAVPRRLPASGGSAATGAAGARKVDDDVVSTEFVLSDQGAGYPRRTVTTTATPDELDALVRTGYLVRRNLLDRATSDTLADAVLKLAEAEAERPEAESLPGKSIYIRSLLDKDAVFHPLIRLEPALSIARTLLGPQVWIDLEARLNFAGRSDVAVPWHAHLPVIPDPMPALFSHPHQIHCLIYLDHVTEREGALCLLPGSHRGGDVRLPLGDQSDRPGQVELFFEPGDAVLIHAGLWHRTVPSSADAGYRRLLLLGYVPSWLRADTGRGVPAERSLTAELARTGDAETRELLGEFQW